MTAPRIIAENEWLIAVDKPAGLIAHSDGRTEEPTLAEWLGETYPALRGVGGAWVSPQGESVPLNGLVHRLDRTTSGTIIAAKNDDAYEYLKNEFRMRRVEKKYLAWVYGAITAQDGTIIAEIMRSSPPSGGPKRWYARACAQDDQRAAITDWHLLETQGDASLLRLSPKTGRTHQLRVHMAHIGHPIVADHLYAPDREPVLGFERVALHALGVVVTLPDGARTSYIAPLPEDFLRASAKIHT
jgi:23S rRNA pseudouridine1911/1915/1917 synthase